MTMLLYVNIEKNFPDFNLKVELEANREVLALLGASGCGKSLILKCIAGIEKPDKGHIVINNTTVFSDNVNLPPQKRRTGFLFQNYALFPTKTVWNNIACVIKKPKSEKQAIVSNIIKKFQLEEAQNLYPRQISGGQQQRTALARILVSEPKILMLDEPFSALDTHLRWQLEQEVASILAEFGGTTVLVSHDRDEVYRMSHKIAVMNNGRIDTKGSKTEIFDNPKTLVAARMTGCKNISRAEKTGNFTLKALNWGIHLQTKDPVPDGIKYIGVRAHHFQISHENNGCENNNVFLCHIHRTIQEPFEDVFIFSFTENSAENSERLLFKMPKQNKIYDTLKIHIPPEKILCLE